MKTTPMRREFLFQGLKLPDPNPQMSIEDVRGVLALQYPEIATAAITGPEPVGDILKYAFELAIGSKGLRCGWLHANAHAKARCSENDSARSRRSRTGSG